MTTARTTTGMRALINYSSFFMSLSVHRVMHSLCQYRKNYFPRVRPRLIGKTGLSNCKTDVEQPSPLSIFRPDDFSTRPQLISPCDTVPRSDKSCSAGVIRAASWPSFCFAFLTGRQLRLISRSATLISSAQYDNSLGKDNYRWISSHEASRVDAAPQM